MTSIHSVAPATLKAWLADAEELALLDVREPGQYDSGHLIAAVPLPYSRLEIDVGSLVPNRTVRVVLCDQGDGVASRAARRMARLGYAGLHVLEGPPRRWRDAGFNVYEGVHTLSKAFGELVAHAYQTPQLGALELAARIGRGESIVIVDGRPYDEYRRMTIPGSICCPNGELALRIGALAPDSATTVVVHCAGRTRSLIGAQSLRSLGLRNPVVALENGTQGWFLAGLELEHGAARTCDGKGPDEAGLRAARSRTAALMRRHGVPQVAAATVNAWRADPQRTTYVFDVRSEAEFAADARPGITHAPGGQLLQATDRWIGVRGARSVLVDGDGVRAGVVAMWLRQMGHDAVVLARGEEARLAPGRPSPGLALPLLPRVDGPLPPVARLIDLRPSAAYRAGHAPGAVWSVRPRVVAAAEGARRVALHASDAGVAGLAALDLVEAGIEVLGYADDVPCTDTSSANVDGPEAIDVIAFARGRHEGDRAAAVQYLRWETGLAQRLSAEERELFAMPAGAGQIRGGGPYVPPS